MTKSVGWIFMSFCFIALILTLSFWPSSRGNVVVVKYDCSRFIGGWHPNVPVKVQEECRRREQK